MEIRGLGVIDVEALFGTLATLDERQIDLVVELIEWSAEDPADRLGLEDDTQELLEVSLPMRADSHSSGSEHRDAHRDRGTQHVLRRRGRHSAREFSARLDDAIARRREKTKRPAVSASSDRRGDGEPPDGMTSGAAPVQSPTIRAKLRWRDGSRSAVGRGTARS